MALSSPRPALPPEVEPAVYALTGRPRAINAARGGFSQGHKVLLETARGLFFVKSAPHGTYAGDAHAAEAAAHAWLPAAASGGLFLAAPETDGHVTLVFRGVRQRRPGALTWQDPDEVRLALNALATAYPALEAAAPPDLAGTVPGFWSHLTFWRDVVEGEVAPPPGLAPGDVRVAAALEAELPDVLSRPALAHQVVHEDLRRDQVLIDTAGRAVIVDWPGVSRTPRIIDAVGLGVSTALSGLPPGLVLASGTPYAGLDAHDVDVVLAGFASYYFSAARTSAGKPAGLATFQLDEARATWRWLHRRLTTPGPDADGAPLG